MTKKMLMLGLSLLIVAAAVCPSTASEIYVRISPEMELLSGVLSQTSWIAHRGPANGGNEYFRALQEFFDPYREHEAVKIAQRLTDRGFTYDAPPAFAAHLGPLPDLELAYEYSEYLIQRAGNRKNLEDFRLALKTLAEEARFMDFYAAWEPYLAEIVAETTAEFEPETAKGWLEQFFGWEAAEFHLILAPAMFPGGGYGVTIDTPDGGLIAYQITRENGISTDRPEFPTGQSLEQLTVHELGHSFVNPSIDAYPKEVNKLRPLYNRVRSEMERQAYGSVGIFLNEQVLRAVEVLAAGELYGAAVVEEQIAYHENRGFYLTRFVLEQLEVYQSNRDQYPTFREFVPVLLSQLADYQAENCSWWEKLRGILPF